MWHELGRISRPETLMGSLSPPPTGEAHLDYWTGLLDDPTFVYVIQGPSLAVGVAEVD